MSIPSSARHTIAALTALRELDASHDSPTPEQLTQLRAWSGWGPVSRALGTDVADEWIDAADAIDELLSEQEMGHALDVCDTSFYTPDLVSEAVFALLERTGFTGGKVLEPGCGAGSLMASAPSHLDISWTGIDVDPVATRIAQHVNPDADIICAPLQSHHFATESFDAVVGNVPFGQHAPYDPEFQTSSSLHGYFVDRALDAVKPGGYLVLVTSRHLIDSVRQLADSVFHSAKLVAAVRLPSGAFDGTEVVADILVLQKSQFGGGLPTVSESYSDSSYYHSITKQRIVHHRTDIGGELVSAYWDEHPEQVAGTMEPTGYDRAPIAVRSRDIPADITRAVQAAAAQFEPEEQVRVGSIEPLADVVLHDAEGRKEGSFHLVEGAMHQVSGGKLRPVARTSKELVALVTLRDAATALIAAEADFTASEETLTPLRTAAREQYDAYVRSFGPIGRGTLTEGKPDPDTGMPTFTWRRPTLGGFRKDPDYLTVLAVEHFDQDTGEASPAPILLRRVNFTPTVISRVDDPTEAARLAASPDGVVDVKRAASLLGLTEGKTVAQLTAQQIAFTDPATDLLTLAEVYLSGNVREKLAKAVDSPVHTAALEAVLPAQVGPMEIQPQLGATWIQPQHVMDFCREVLSSSLSLSYVWELGSWQIGNIGTTSNIEINTQYGTPDISPSRLLALALNNTVPVIYDEYWEDGRTRKVKNSEKSLAAEEKQQELQTRFETWLWEDADRAAEVCAEYNRRFRSHVARRGNGSYLSFPGMSEDICLWGNQRDAIDRAVSQRAVIINHPVGAGKTLMQIASAMKLRELGLANKPLVIVPNHLLEQIAREARLAYPTGKFLIAGREEVSKENKRLFAARCATGDWDLVIMTHTAFLSIPVDGHLQSRWVNEEKAELRNVLSGLDRWDSKSQRRIATRVRSLEAQLHRLLDDSRRDEHSITFEQLGIDHLSVDELHYYRRLMVTSSSQSGFSLGHSKRATDLLLKVQSLTERFPGKPVFAGYTGTLVSNTLAEIYVWQKFVQPERLHEAGLHSFDAWAATFIRFETAVEVKPTGSGFHMKRRPRKVQNAAELRAMLAENCDSVTADSIGLERPTHTVHDVVSKPSDQQLESVELLSERADRIYAGLVSRDEDNMLAICGEGRLLALDPELVGVAGGSPSLRDAAERIAKIYHEGANRPFPGSDRAGVFQLVLCDVGTPGANGSQSYGRLRSELVRRGVPADRVRFVHEAKTDKARAALFAQCRSGEVSVLIGSTPKVGVGTNIQTRLAALHHLDAPWMPSDVEQREGRALRPKNLAEHVDIYRYVTEGTFDALTWETLERKHAGVASFLSGDSTAREVDDLTGVTLSYGQVKALATGRPELLRLAELAVDVRRLQVMKSVWAQQVNAASSRAARLRQDIASDTYQASNIQEAQRVRVGAEPGQGAERMAHMVKKPIEHQGWRTSDRIASGTILGLPCGISLDRGSKEFALTIGSSPYRDVLTVPLPRRLMRRKADVLAAELTRLVTSFIDGAPQALASIADNNERREREAAELDAFIARAAFADEEQLRQALAEQSRIQAMIEESADRKDELVAA